MRNFSVTAFLLLLSYLLPVYAASRKSGTCRLPPPSTPSTTEGKVATAWFAGFHATTGFSVAQIPWSKYTHLTYAFAVTTPDVHTLSFEGSHPEVLPDFVAAAHKNNVKAFVSIGGWTGSRWFSSNVGSASNRTAFVKTVTDMATKYQLDGIDFDWEYPNSQGIGCNVINSNDTPNFLSFLQELRQTSVGKKLMLTAATSIRPFTGPNGSPVNVAPFAAVLDYVAVMNYDLWGPWSPTVGPNAPLDDSCASSANQIGSATAAINAWNSAGMPLNQLVLGVPGYGHGFRVRKADAFVAGSTTELALYPKFDAVDRPKGDAWDDGAGVDACGVQQLAGSVFTFWGLMTEGFLAADGKPKSGIASRFDTCSQTPFVYNPQTEVMVSYDNDASFTSKGKFIKSKGLRGFAMWEAGGDSNNILVNSIRSAAGF